MHGTSMRFHWKKYDTGWGELLCLVLAWVIGAGAIWADYLGRSQVRSGDKVAVGSRATTPSYLD